MYDIIITKAAGNLGVEEGLACPYTLNSVCVGGTSFLPEGSLRSSSSWLNASTSDREEPDVMALASSVLVAKHDSNTGIVLTGGTSLASPTVAAAAALCRQEAGGSLSALGYRALVMMSPFASSRNVHGTRYSTPDWTPPSGVIDHRDGAGRIDGDELSHWCDGPGDKPEGGWGIIPDYDFGDAEPMDPTEEFEQPEPDSIESNDKTWDSAPVGVVLKELEEVNEGADLRAGIVWHACPELMQVAAPAEVTTDYDLGLFHVESGEYVMLSDSFFDNHEGFHVVAPDKGTYQIRLLHSPEATGCSPNKLAWYWRLQG